MQKARGTYSALAVWLQQESEGTNHSIGNAGSPSLRYDAEDFDTTIKTLVRCTKLY